VSADLQSFTLDVTRAAIPVVGLSSINVMYSIALRGSSAPENRLGGCYQRSKLSL